MDMTLEHGLCISAETGSQDETESNTDKSAEKYNPGNKDQVMNCCMNFSVQWTKGIKLDADVNKLTADLCIL